MTDTRFLHDLIQRIEDATVPGVVTRPSDVTETSRALRVAFGDELSIEGVTYRSGAITVYVRHGETSACIRTEADTGEWRYTVGRYEAWSVSSPEHVAGSLEETIEGLCGLWSRHR